MRLTLLLLLSCCTGIARAQSPTFFSTEGQDRHRTFYGGFAAGANFSQVDGDGYSGYNKVGLNVGPLIYARLSKTFAVSLELLYTQKGSRSRSMAENDYGVPYQDQYDLKLNYMEVPVMLHIIDNPCMPRANVGAGIAYARLLNSKEEAFTTNQVNLYPDIYTFRKDDLSVVAEAGYELYKGLFINLRYSYSLKTIRDANRIPLAYGGDRYSRQLNNLFALRFILLVK